MRCRWGLQASGEQSDRPESTLVQGADHRINRVRISRSQVRPIEAYDCKRLGSSSGCGNDPGAWEVKAKLRHGFVTNNRARIQPSRKRQLLQRRLRRDSASRVAQRRKTPQGRDRQGRQRVETCILASICGQNGQGNAISTGQILNLHQTVRPIALATDQADEYASGPGQRPLNIGIERKRMPQRHQICQTQRRQISRRPVPACRESPKVAIRERQYHKLGRILTEIGGSVSLL